MKSLKLIMFDIRNGILRYWYRYVAVFAVFVLSALSLWSTSEISGNSASALTLGDYFVYVFAGMKEYIFDPRNPFNFPPLWMFIFLTISYLTLNYPYQDLMGSGKHELIESGSRSVWWYSKCCWVLLSVVLFYAAAALGLVFFVLLSGGFLNISVSPTITSIIDFGVDCSSGPWDIAPLLTLLPVMTIAVCLIQLMLSLVIKPVPSFLCTVTLLFFSIYFKTNYLPGNYLMVIRSEIFLVSGVSWIYGVVIALVAIIFTVMLGRSVFANADIMEKR